MTVNRRNFLMGMAAGSVVAVAPEQKWEWKKYTGGSIYVDKIVEGNVYIWNAKKHRWAPTGEWR